MKFKNPFGRGRRSKYLSKEQQIKRSLIKGIVLGIITAIVIILIYQFLIIPRVRENERISVMNNLKKSESKDLYAAKEELKQGQVLDESDLKIIRLPQELTPKDSIMDESNLIGKVLRMNVSKNNILTKSIVTSQDDALTADLRKQDYDHIVLNYNLKIGDYVDIRIRYKDGSDYRVATKKKILDLNGTEAVYQITEDERDYINNSTVEAAIKGGVLYTTIYKDPENQPAADVNYTLDDNVKNLIEANPDVVKDAQNQLRQNVKPIQNSQNNSTNNQNTQNSASSQN